MCFNSKQYKSRKNNIKKLWTNYINIFVIYVQKGNTVLKNYFHKIEKRDITKSIQAQTYNKIDGSPSKEEVRQYTKDKHNLPAILSVLYNIAWEKRNRLLQSKLKVCKSFEK